MSDVASVIDRKEKVRINELAKALESGKKVEDEEVFASKTIANMLHERPVSLFDSFDGISLRLPLNSLLYSRTIVEICPRCECSAKPSLIVPFLERGLVLPLLRTPLSSFRPEFVNTLVSYPYMSTYSRSFVKLYGSGEALACPHCYDKEWKKIFSEIDKLTLDKKLKDEIRKFLTQYTKVMLFAPTSEEFLLLEQLREVIKQGRLELLMPLNSEGKVLELFRFAKSFNAIPQTDRRDIVSIKKLSNDLGLKIEPNVSPDIEEKELALTALNIDYNPKMQVEDYLDIIIPRRNKINALVNDVIMSKDKEKRIAEINDAIWEINKEVSSSKALETLNFVTSLARDNLGIIAGLLIGAVGGYGFGEALGCGIGSAGGAAASFLGQKLLPRTGLRIPKYPKKTAEWIKAKLESPEEKLLAQILSKDVKAIQVWSLKKKLSNQK